MTANNPHNYTPAHAVRNVDESLMVNWQGCMNILTNLGIVLYHDIGDTLDDGTVVQHANECPTLELEDFFYTVYREWSMEDIIDGQADAWIDARHVYLWLDLPIDELGEIEQHKDVPYVFGEYTTNRRKPLTYEAERRHREEARRLRWAELAPLNVMRCRVMRVHRFDEFFPVSEYPSSVERKQERRAKMRNGDRRERIIARRQKRVARYVEIMEDNRLRKAQAEQERREREEKLNKAQVRVIRATGLPDEFFIFCDTKERAFELVTVEEYAEGSIHGVRCELATFETEEEAQQEADRLNAEGFNVATDSRWLGQSTTEERRYHQMMNDHRDPWAKCWGIATR